MINLKRIKQDFLILILSGIVYSCIEIAWRGYTHWTMVITGGLCFLSIFRLYNRIHNYSLWKKCIIGALVITCIEFLSGCIVNIWLHMNVWDYSYQPMNLLGQICLLYTLLWTLLCIPIYWIISFLYSKNLFYKDY